MSGTPKIQVLGFGYSKEEADDKFATVEYVDSLVSGVEEELIALNEGGIE